MNFWLMNSTPAYVTVNKNVLYTKNGISYLEKTDQVGV